MAGESLVENKKVGFWKRTAEILTGHGTKLILDWGYDWLVYPFLMWYFGNLIGGLLAAAGSIALCFWLLVMYERQKKDWLGFKTLNRIKKELETYLGGKPHGHYRLLKWALEKSDYGALVVVSIYGDPFETVVYLRHGEFDGLRRKDYIIFAFSAVISNVYWAFRTGVLLWALGSATL